LPIDGAVKLQATLTRFLPNPLSINVTATDYGVMELNGVTFNSNTKMLAVCGGKQVNPRIKSIEICIDPFLKLNI